jgi:hypothetical protein
VPVVAAPKPVPAAKAVAAKPVAAAPAASRTVAAPAEKTPVRTASAPSTAKVQAKPAVKSAAPARKPAFRQVRKLSGDATSPTQRQLSQPAKRHSCPAAAPHQRK